MQSASNKVSALKYNVAKPLTFSKYFFLVLWCSEGLPPGRSRLQKSPFSLHIPGAQAAEWSLCSFLKCELTVAAFIALTLSVSHNKRKHEMPVYSEAKLCLARRYTFLKYISVISKQSRDLNKKTKKPTNKMPVNSDLSAKGKEFYRLGKSEDKRRLKNKTILSPFKKLYR